jgi:Tfp pilus assembly protein PilF
LNPNFDQAMTGLSRVLVYLGKDDEAAQWARNALKVNPANSRAWYQLGIIESKTDKNAAIEDYQKAVSIQGSFAPLRRDLGLLYFQKGNYAEAADQLAKAAELGVNDAPLYNFLGISYGHTNRLDKAVEAYKKAIRLDPKLAEAHLNVGYAYQRLNQIRAAEEEYATACRLEARFCQFAPHP